MRALVAGGKIQDGTTTVTYYFSNDDWQPQDPPEPDDTDWDLVRKIEQESNNA